MESHVQIRAVMRKADIALVIWTLLLLLLSPLAISKSPIFNWHPDKDSTDVSEPRPRQAQPRLLLAMAEDDVPVKITNEMQPPRRLHGGEPTYTDAAREAKVSGSVVLEGVIDKSGQPSNLRVVRGLGYGLDESALEAVGQWKFEPARWKKSGNPVTVFVTIETHFRLL